MSGKYDIETFLATLIATVKSNLSAKIDEINSEKDDGICLKTIDDEDYYSQTNDQIWNKNQFIYYTIADLETNTNGGSTAITISVNIEIVFDNTNKTDTLEKVLRYSRCLREVVQSNFKEGKHANLKISELLPGNLVSNDGADFKIGGVVVQSTIVG